MAKLGGLFPLFTAANIRKQLDDKRKEFEKKTLEALQYLGEEFVNKAREFGEYTDRTGNLRSSVGYVILKDGEMIDSNFELSAKGTEKQTGLQRGMEFAEELAILYGTGYVLIGVAGMQYAAAVESKGYDVITNSAPSDKDVSEFFGEIEF